MKIAAVFVDVFTFHSSFLRLAPQKGVLNLCSLLLNTDAQKAFQKWKIHWKHVFGGALWRLHLSRLVLKLLHVPHTREENKMKPPLFVCACVTVGVRERSMLSRRLLLNRAEEGLLKWINPPLKRRGANKRLDVAAACWPAASQCCLNCCSDGWIQISLELLLPRQHRRLQMWLHLCGTKQTHLSGSGY